MKYLFTLSIILVMSFAQAQEKRKTISVSYGFGNGSLFTFQKGYGMGLMEGKSLTSFGANYSYELAKKNLYLETGLIYVTYKYTVTSFYPPSPSRSWDYTKNLISIPVKLRYEAGKYIFFNGGLYLDIDVSKKYNRELSGIGARLGVGLQYYFKNKFGIYINPQFDLRNVATCSGSGSKLADSQIAVGLSYKIK